MPSRPATPPSVVAAIGESDAMSGPSGVGGSAGTLSAEDVVKLTLVPSLHGDKYACVQIGEDERYTTGDLLVADAQHIVALAARVEELSAEVGAHALAHVRWVTEHQADTDAAWRNQREAEARAEAMEKALLDANDMCRSAYSIARHDGRETDWSAWRNALKASLDRQHVILASTRAALAAEHRVDEKE